MQTSVMPKAASSGVPHLDLSRIAQDLQIRKVQVESVVQLLDEGNTVPFITRYRKERTGGLNEEIIRTIQARVQQLRQLADRKQTILKSIENQGKLTDELRAAILAAEAPKRLEDLYLPYKPKKRTLATAAREKGLEPLAQALWNRDPAVANLDEVLATLVNPEKGLPTPAEVLQGVQHLLAEQIAETADVRAAVRSVLWETGKLCTSKSEKLAEGQGLDFKDYFQFTESALRIPPHRILAINRGEKEGALQVRLEWNSEAVQKVALSKLPLADHPHAELLKTTAADALTRLLLPSLEREIRRELTKLAEDHAVHVFARNLRSLLLAPPLRNRRVLAIDPGFKSGCKLAALDEIGNLLEDAVIFPHQPQNKKDEARLKLEELLRKHYLQVVAIGNGTACRETEELIAELIAEFERRRSGAPRIEAAAVPAAADTVPASMVALAPAPMLWSISATITADQPPPAVEAWPAASPAATPAPEAGPVPLPPLAALVEPRSSLLAALPEPLPELAYIIVNEAGASVYSASAVGREEFPNYDATLRGTISIGRRLQDPLSELVKIDPHNIGVGLYQHDVNPRELKESLDAVIESCVNHVGVDLNTASLSLLRHVSGLNQHAARELVEYRKQHGPFRQREQLLHVHGIGEARYTQAAGFLKIAGGDNPLDRTWIHPESYALARQLLAELGYGPEALNDRHQTEELRQKLQTLPAEAVAPRLQAGTPTVQDICEALARPGRDPRDDLPPPIFKKGILKLEDLTPGMELKGTVLNVVDFGAFIDIGLKDSGLVHISQLANHYIKNPYNVVAVGDVVTVWVLTVDHNRRRVSLTMIKPGTERKPLEKKPPPPPRPPQREPRGSRPPRGRRPAHARRAGPPPQGQAPAPPEGTATAVADPPAAQPIAQEPGPRKAPAAAQGPPPQRPAPRPRKPPRLVPKPKLSQAALEGKAPLRTFSELAALLEAKKKEEPPPPPPPVPSSESPPPPA